MDPIMLEEINGHTTEAVAGIDLSQLQTAISSLGSKITNVSTKVDTAISTANTIKSGTDNIKRSLGLIKSSGTTTLCSNVRLNVGDSDRTVVSLSNVLIYASGDSPRITVSEIYSASISCKVYINGALWGSGSGNNINADMLKIAFKAESLVIKATNTSRSDRYINARLYNCEAYAYSI